MKVSRSLKERAAQIHQARTRLTGTLGREPAVSELAAELGLTPEEIAMAETATGMAESIQRESGDEASPWRMCSAQTGWRIAFWNLFRSGMPFRT